MERLTEKTGNYYGEQQKIRKYCYMGFDGDCKYHSCAGCTILKLYRRLAEYEDLEEQERAIKSPCDERNTIQSQYEAAESILNDIYQSGIIGETAYNVINQALQSMRKIIDEREGLQ